jgi:hypothetical protein
MPTSEDSAPPNAYMEEQFRRLSVLFRYIERVSPLFNWVRTSSARKFCIFCGSGESQSSPARVCFFLTNTDQIHEAGRAFTLDIADLEALNPQSKTCPAFRNVRDAEITKGIYRRVPAWSRHTVTPTWPGVPKTPFNMSNDSILFLPPEGAIAGGSNTLPVYESKFIFQLNHRFASACSDMDYGVRDLNASELADPNCFVVGQHYMATRHLHERFPGNWYVVYRMITNATNERTCVAAIIPQRPCVHSLSILDALSARNALYLVAELNSFVHDYCTRHKVAGTNFNHWIWHQLPIMKEEEHHNPCRWDQELSLGTWQALRVLELTYTAWDLALFAKDCGYDGPPFRWDESRRFLLRCELDAAYFHLYGIERDDVDYIMDTFPIVRRKDETAQGEYRTKRVILEIYDAMAESIRAGQPYQTRLDPPPGPPTDTEGNFFPIAQWDHNYWPPHIHAKKTEAHT